MQIWKTCLQKSIQTNNKLKYITICYVFFIHFSRVSNESIIPSFSFYPSPSGHPGDRGQRTPLLFSPKQPPNLPRLQPRRSRVARGKIGNNENHGGSMMKFNCTFCGSICLVSFWSKWYDFSNKLWRARPNCEFEGGIFWEMVRFSDKSRVQT